LIVEAISGSRQDFHKFFYPGIGLDIREDDIQGIVSKDTGKELFWLNSLDAEPSAGDDRLEDKAKSQR
jgi:hypothetical protein